MYHTHVCYILTYTYELHTPTLQMYTASCPLTSFLCSSSFQGKLTLLCDANTDGSFLVHHFLSFYLKGKGPIEATEREA